MNEKYRETSHGGLAEMYQFLSETIESIFSEDEWDEEDKAATFLPDEESPEA